MTHDCENPSSLPSAIRGSSIVFLQRVEEVTDNVMAGVHVTLNTNPLTVVVAHLDFYARLRDAMHGGHVADVEVIQVRS